MKDRILNIIEFAPLSIFLIYIRSIDTSNPAAWQGPWLASGGVALAVILLFIFQKRIFHRIFLGINVYLLSGAAAFVTHQWWLTGIYDNLRASGVLLWVIATGIVSTIFSPRGFLGIDSFDAKAVKKYSFYLLIVAVLAFAVSLGFRGNHLLSELVPFMSLYLAYGFFNEKCKGQGIR